MNYEAVFFQLLWWLGEVDAGKAPKDLNLSPGDNSCEKLIVFLLRWIMADGLTISLGGLVWSRPNFYPCTEYIILEARLVQDLNGHFFKSLAVT